MESSEVSSREYWRRHLEGAKEFCGSDVEYCRQNGLKPGTFSYWKNQLGFTEKPKRVLKKKRFSKVVLSPPVAVQRSEAVLPDAKWVAEFLRAWGELNDARRR